MSEDTDAYPNLDTMCRLCLKKDMEEMVSIFPEGDDTSKPRTPISIPMRIMACAALEVQINDGLPKFVCSDCRFQLEKSYYFRKMSQASDRRVRKHIRLLGLGKKSKVFAKSSDDDLECELEFEVFLDFLKEQDGVYDGTELESQKTFLEMERDFEARKAKISKENKEIILNKEKILLQELRESVKEELRQKLMSETELEIREEIRTKCIEEAKIELRQEVREECREEELNAILEELATFLKSKRINQMLDGVKAQIVKNPNANTPSPTEKEQKPSQSKGLKRRLSTPSAPNVAVKELKLDVKAVSRSRESSVNESEQNNADEPIPFNVVISKSLDCVEGEVNDDDGDDDDEGDDDIYIVESEEVGEEGTKEMPEDDSDSIFESRTSNFRVTASESSDRQTTSYKIEDDGEIQFFEKGKYSLEDQEKSDEEDNGDSEVMVFDFDQEDEKLDIEFLTINNRLVLRKPIGKHEETKPDASTLAKHIKQSRIRAMSNNDLICKEGESNIRSTTDTLKTFKCASCPREFSTENSLTRHLNTHLKTEEKGFAHECPTCQIVVSCRSALKRHMLTHTGKRPHTCEECGKSFTQREVLKRHMQSHTGVRPHKCPYCERTFTQKVNLTQHINNNHMDVPKLQQHQCHICPKRFNHASGLSRHLITHNGITFQCTACKRIFADRSSIKRHIGTVHGNFSAENDGMYIFESTSSDDLKNEDNTMESTVFG